jgi:hypothetical protein
LLTTSTCCRYAAGVTNQQRNAAAERAVGGRRPGSAKPRDDEQRERTSHRPFTARMLSHIFNAVDPQLESAWLQPLSLPLDP